MTPDIYIGVGANINPGDNILKALDLLREKVQVTASSGFYKTEPVGDRNQPCYINGAWKITSTLSPADLKFGVLRAIEAALGRERTADKYISRPADLDILLYGSKVINEQGMIIPDPDIITRPFIAFPLYEIDPQLVIPGVNRPIKSVVAEMNKNRMVYLAEYTKKIMDIIKRKYK